MVSRQSSARSHLQRDKIKPNPRCDKDRTVELAEIIEASWRAPSLCWDQGKKYGGAEFMSGALNRLNYVEPPGSCGFRRFSHRGPWVVFLKSELVNRRFKRFKRFRRGNEIRGLE